MDQTQNDSFGSFSNSQGGYTGQPGMYSTAPIMLDNSEEKKSKKWVIIGVLMVLCVALIAFVIVFTGSRKDSPTVPQNLSQINEELSKYSSTILYGDGRQVDLSTLVYSDLSDYRFRNEIMNDNQEYMDSVLKKFNSMNNLIIEKNDLALTDDDKNYLDVYKDKLQFLKIYLSSLDEDPLIIVKKLVDGGEKEAISYIETQYSKYNNSKNTSLRDYFAYKVEYEKLAINVLLRTNVNECVVPGSLTLGCEIESLITDEEALRIQEIQDEMRMIVNTNIKYVITGCWSIYNIVNGVENV